MLLNATVLFFKDEIAPTPIKSCDWCSYLGESSCHIVFKQVQLMTDEIVVNVSSALRQTWSTATLPAQPTRLGSHMNVLLWPPDNRPCIRVRISKIRGSIWNNRTTRVLRNGHLLRAITPGITCHGGNREEISSGGDCVRFSISRYTKSSTTRGHSLLH